MSYIIALVAGAVVTSYAEYHFKYNLFDYILDGIKFLRGVFSSSKTKGSN